MVAFGYSKFPGAENPKSIATAFKFGTQGIIYLLIWLWILEYLYTDEPRDILGMRHKSTREMNFLLYTACTWPEDNFKQHF